MQGEFGEVPGAMKPELAPAVRLPELSAEEKRRLRERAEASVEALRNPHCSPEIGRFVVTKELLLPAEEGGYDIPTYASDPASKELLRRCETKVTVPWLGALVEQEITKIDEQIIQFTGMLEKASGPEKEAIERDIVPLKERRVWYKQIGLREKELLQPQEVAGWERVYGETEAALALQRAWFQRTTLESDVNSYAESLFLSPFTLETVSPP